MRRPDGSRAAGVIIPRHRSIRRAPVGLGASTSSSLALPNSTGTRVRDKSAHKASFPGGLALFSALEGFQYPCAEGRLASGDFCVRIRVAPSLGRVSRLVAWGGGVEIILGEARRRWSEDACGCNIYRRRDC